MNIRSHIGHAGRGVSVGNCGGLYTRVLSPSNRVGSSARNVYAKVGLAMAMVDSTRAHVFLLPHILLEPTSRERVDTGLKRLALDKPRRVRLWHINQVRICRENRTINENATHIRVHLKEFRVRCKPLASEMSILSCQCVQRFYTYVRCDSESERRHYTWLSLMGTTDGPHHCA